MQPHYSQFSRENATPSNGTSLLASCKGVPPPPPGAMLLNYKIDMSHGILSQLGPKVITLGSFLTLGFKMLLQTLNVGTLFRGGVLPYMGYIGMCRCEGYGFQAVYSRTGYINQSVWL